MDFNFSLFTFASHKQTKIMETLTMTIAELRRLLFDTNKYAVIGENEMTNGEARAYLYEMPNQNEILSVIDMGDHVLVTEAKKITLKDYVEQNACPIKFEKTNYTPHQLAKRSIDFEVYLPDYGKNLQRDFVWSLKQKQELIKSMIVGRNIPPIYAIIKDVTKDQEIIQIIDGKQRLSTILLFLRDGFLIPILGQKMLFSQLDSDFQYRIAHFYLDFMIAYEYSTETKQNISDRKKVETYKFFAQAGTPQDIAHIDSF